MFTLAKSLEASPRLLPPSPSSFQLEFPFYKKREKNSYQNNVTGEEDSGATVWKDRLESELLGVGSQDAQAGMSWRRSLMLTFALGGSSLCEHEGYKAEGWLTVDRSYNECTNYLSRSLHFQMYHMQTFKNFWLMIILLKTFSTKKFRFEFRFVKEIWNVLND